MDSPLWTWEHYWPLVSEAFQHDSLSILLSVWAGREGFQKESQEVKSHILGEYLDSYIFNLCFCDLMKILNAS